jgi:hypothetical protein
MVRALTLRPATVLVRKRAFSVPDEGVTPRVGATLRRDWSPKQSASFRGAGSLVNAAVQHYPSGIVPEDADLRKILPSRSPGSSRVERNYLLREASAYR